MCGSESMKSARALRASIGAVCAASRVEQAASWRARHRCRCTKGGGVRQDGGVNANDVATLAEMREPIFMRVHADGVDLVALGFEHGPKAEHKGARTLGVREDEVRIFEYEHPREVLDDKLHREAEHLAATQGVVFAPSLAGGRERLAGGTSDVEVESRPVVTATPDVPMDCEEVAVASTLDIVVVKEAPGRIPNVTSEGLLERNGETEEGHGRGARAASPAPARR